MTPAHIRPTLTARGGGPRVSAKASPTAFAPGNRPRTGEAHIYKPTPIAS